MQTFFLPTGAINVDFDNNRDIEDLLRTFMPEQIATEMIKVFQANQTDQKAFLENMSDFLDDVVFWMNHDRDMIDRFYDDVKSGEKKMSKATVNELIGFINNDIEEQVTRIENFKEDWRDW